MVLFFLKTKMYKNADPVFCQALELGRPFILAIFIIQVFLTIIILTAILIVQKVIEVNKA